MGSLNMDYVYRGCLGAVLIPLGASYLQKYGFYQLGVVLVPLGDAPGDPGAPKVWNLSGIQFVSLSTASIPNFSFLSPKI